MTTQPHTNHTNQVEQLIREVEDLTRNDLGSLDRIDLSRSLVLLADEVRQLAEIRASVDERLTELPDETRAQVNDRIGKLVDAAQAGASTTPGDAEHPTCP